MQGVGSPGVGFPRVPETGRLNRTGESPSAPVLCLPNKSGEVGGVKV